MSSEGNMNPLSQILETLLKEADSAGKFAEELIFTKVDTTAAVAAKEHAVNLKAEFERLLGQHSSSYESLSDQVLRQFTERLNSLAGELHSIRSEHVDSAKVNEGEADDYYLSTEGITWNAQKSRDQLEELMHRLAVMLGQKAEMPETSSMTFNVNRDIAEAFNRQCKQDQSSPDQTAAAAILEYIESGRCHFAKQRLDEVERGRKIRCSHEIAAGAAM